MNNSRDQLKTFAPSQNDGGEVILEIIEKLTNDQVRRCLNYLNELEETDHPHTITSLGYDDSGLFFIKTSTGTTLL